MPTLTIMVGYWVGCAAASAARNKPQIYCRIRLSACSYAAQEPRAYLTTIARRLLANHYRRQSLEQAWLQVLRSAPEAIVTSAEERWQVLETLQQIDAALDSLKPRARQVFLLSQLEGLSYAQIAERTGVHVRTIKRDMALAFEHCLLLLA
jgi:RNA polymerase sigma factor (sigma-70 family)